MYNLRYHIASLVAVFLSLSIGLLLGTIVVERGTLDRQKDAIVKSLQEEFRTLDTANTELRERATSREDLIDDLLPAVIEGELADTYVLVIVGTGRVDGLGTVSEAIQDAGGVPVVMVLSVEWFGLEDPEVSAVVTETVDAAVDMDSLKESVVAELAREWGAPAEGRPLTARLEEAGVLRVDGEPDPTVPVTGVVTLAAFGDGPDIGALALASAFASGERVAVGVEAVSQATGVAAAAIEEGVSGVDHIGTPEGTFSLIYVLAGRASGHFGYGEGATSAWPTL